MKTRDELIATAKEMNLTFERPINQVKSEVIEAAIQAALAETEATIVEEVKAEVDEMPDEVFVNIGVITPEAAVEVKVKKVTIADEILAYAQAGKSRTVIYNELKEKHAKLNYRYVVQTLLKAKAAGIELNVPRQERVFTPKEETIAALEAKLAKMKAALNPNIEEGTEE